jgi:hypothetical protein
VKYLDFDELDKAVSSLLGSAGKEAKESVQEPASETTDVVAPTQNTIVSPSKSLVEKRSSGRFMDVVHPSSDMKNLQKPAVSRQAPTITPPETPIASPETPEATPEPTSQTTPDTVTSPIEKEEPVTDSHIMPDPLDFHNFTMDETPSSTVDTSEVAEDATVDAAIDVPKNEEAPSSLDTPFVSDSSVEKRPLGAFSTSTDEPVPQSEATELTEPMPELTSTTDATENEAVVDQPDERAEDHDSEVTSSSQEEPASLSEKNTPSLEAESVPTTSENAYDDDIKNQLSPVPEDSVPEELREDIVAVEAREATAMTANGSVSVPAGGSITQQYAEKATPQSTEQTPVFDTKQYHQPLKHAEKKKSGWLTVVLIIAFVILGVGGGAAIYFFDPFGLLQ